MAKPATARAKEKPASRSDSSVPRRPPGPTTPAAYVPLWRTLAAVAALLVLVIVCYFNSIPNGFTWDDHQQIEMNAALSATTPLSRLVFSDVWALTPQHIVGSPKIYYRPLQMVTYRLIAATAGLDPAAFHLASLVGVSIAAILSFAAFWVLTRRLAVAFAAAALFAVHPTHSESVDWASAIPDLGCTIFLLAAFSLLVLAFPRPLPQPAPGPSRVRQVALWVLSLLCFAAALLWKETAAVLPVLVIAYVVVCSEQDGLSSRLKRAAALSSPFWAMLAAYLYLRFRVLGHLTEVLQHWELSPLQLVLSAAHLMMQYWWKLLVPVPLNAFYVFAPVRSAWSLAAISGVVFLLLAAAGIVYLARRVPLLAFAALWVFLTLLPVMDVYAVGRNVFTERYLFLPSVGFCLFLALLGWEAIRGLPERFRTVAAVFTLAAGVVLCVLETRARNQDWQSDTVLFAKTLEESPTAPFVQNMVAATEKTDAAGSRAAEAHYLRALALASSETPQDRLQMARACEGLAAIYSDRSDFAHALEYLERVRRITPSDPEVDGEEGLILSKAGQWDEAARYLRRAVAAGREDENVLNALGILALQHSHQFAEATGYFSRALAIHTAADDFAASLHSNLGAVYGEQGRYADAANQFQIAVSIAPQDPEYRTNFALALAATNQYDEARNQLRSVLTIAPDYQPAREALQQLAKH